MFELLMFDNDYKVMYFFFKKIDKIGNLSKMEMANAHVSSFQSIIGFPSILHCNN